MGGAVATGALSTLTGCAGKNRGVTKSKKPNLLFVFTDQQSFDMLKCYGNESIITPNIDIFSKEGVRFNQCISSSPVCSPMRAMLFSGMHPFYNGCFANDVPMIHDNGKYFAHVLNDANYRTGYIGKWHLLGGNRDQPVPKGPYRYGFDDVFLSNNIHVNFNPGHCFYWNDKGEKEYFDEWEVYGQTRQALQFLDECNKEDPFALFVSWHPPHDIGFQKGTMYWNYNTEKELMKMYDPDKIKLRPNVEDCPGIRKSYHGYMALCSGIDIAFGRLMNKLKEKGLDDNTIVVFTSDHGDLLSSHGRSCPKTYPEDESICVPLIIRSPGQLKANRTSDLLVGSMDLMPTILNLMNLPIPKTCQGRDLSKHIVSGNDDAVESVPLMFNAANYAWRGVYTRDYTYSNGTSMAYAPDKKKHFKIVENNANVLYDRKSDPWQINNIYGSKEHKSLQDKMHSLSLNWLDHFGERPEDARKIMELYNRERRKGNLRRPIDILNMSRG